MTGKESNDSMEDLFLKAKKDYEQVHAILMEAKEGKPCKERFVAFVRGINHDGEPYGSKMEHFDLAWKKHPGDVPDKR